MEIGFRECPTTDRKGDAVFLLDVAFAIEREKDAAGTPSVVDQRAGNGVEGRSLVEVGVRGTQHPIEFRYLDSYTNAGIGGVLRNLAREVSKSQATVEGEPRGGLELVFHEERFQVSRGICIFDEAAPGTVIGIEGEK